MAFRVLHGLAPPCLNDLVRVADLPGRRRLRSSSSHQLLVPPTFRLTTVGRRTLQSLHPAPAPDSSKQVGGTKRVESETPKAWSSNDFAAF